MVYSKRTYLRLSFFWKTPVGCDREVEILTAREAVISIRRVIILGEEFY